MNENKQEAKHSFVEIKHINIINFLKVDYNCINATSHKSRNVVHQL